MKRSGGDMSIGNNYQKGVFNNKETASETISHNRPAMLH
jgi:hypothetical protein